MSKKKNLPKPEKILETIRREQEIKDHGKIISLRPGKIHESKKTYKRIKKVNVDEN